MKFAKLARQTRQKVDCGHEYHAFLAVALPQSFCQIGDIGDRVLLISRFPSILRFAHSGFLGKTNPRGIDRNATASCYHEERYAFRLVRESDGFLAVDTRGIFCG